MDDKICTQEDTVFTLDNFNMSSYSIHDCGDRCYAHSHCNYFSIGMTARGAMAFHEERENRPGRFTSPLKNKIIYAQKGCGMVCADRMCHPTVAGRVSVQVMPSSGATYEDVDVANHLCEINVLNIQFVAWCNMFEH